ncbi:hypothetical protein [Streptomyces sp. NPDC059861]|uniref:hypothetical protein n=1 Tax=Streptomyces sp. NPDC059861 TaxID=3346974 RepID=UPI00365025A5
MVGASRGAPCPARTTALVGPAQDLPPAILGPMLGLHSITAAQWRHRASTDWTACLAAQGLLEDIGEEGRAGTVGVEIGVVDGEVESRRSVPT